jgi:hypothetical protein
LTFLDKPARLGAADRSRTIAGQLANAGMIPDRSNRMMQLVLAVGLVLALFGGGEDTQLTAEQKAELARYFGFGPMQMYKFDSGVGPFQIADLDQDGRADVIVWNRQKSRFDVFYQPDPDAPTEPSAEPLEQNELGDRGPLRKQRVPVNYNVASFDIGDLTADGRPDIVFFGEPKEVVILPGAEDGGFGPPETIRASEGEVRNLVLALGDFNSDQRTDVALRGTDLLLVFHQKPGGGLAKPERLVHGIDNPMLMLAADLDGDGRDDLVVGSDDEPHGLYVCRQEADGTLAAFRPVRIPRLRSISVAPRADGQPGDDLYCIELETGRLKHYRWQTPEETHRDEEWVLRLHSYPIVSTSKERPVALGDVDGDGKIDCVVADPDAAQLILFRGTGTGLGAGAAFPSLSQVSDIEIADIDADGEMDIILASPEEKMVGRSKLEDGRLSFPRPLKTGGEPFVVAVGAAQRGGKPDRIAWVARDEDEEIYWLMIEPLAGGEQQALELEEVEDDPTALRFVDVDQDGRQDLLLVVRYAPPIVFLQDDAGQFAPFAGSDTRDWLLKEVDPAGVAVADVTGDQVPELLLAQERLARALRVRDGHWTVVDQYNAESADVRIGGIAALPQPSGPPTLAMYEQKGDDLLIFKPREDKTYAVANTVSVGNFDLTAMAALPLAGEHVALLLAGSDKLATLVPARKAATLVELGSYETEAKDAWLGDSVIGDVNHDGIRDVVLVDLGKASLEILTTTPAGKLVQAVRFQVFQGRRFSDAPESRGEPRQVLLGDLTGDGHEDIVLLVHDRMIIYPAQ